MVEVGEDDGSGRGPKIGCSIKLVDQKTGEDMDPMGSRYKPRGEGGPGGRPGAPALGASAGKGCGEGGTGFQGGEPVLRKLCRRELMAWQAKQLRAFLTCFKVPCSCLHADEHSLCTVCDDGQGATTGHGVHERCYRSV